MPITIVSLPTCKQCDMVKRILAKYKKVFTVEEHDNPELDEYPLVKMNGESFCYTDFLKFVRAGGLNEVKI